jgi:Bifunctional DNA primase/polymerase, N-terminal
MARLGGWERPQLPPTCTVISGRLDGGQHQFFKNPHRGDYDGAKARLPRGIDLKDGGRAYRVLPPSVHPDTGGVYFYRKGTRDLRAELPVEIHRILLKPPVRKAAPVGNRTVKPTGNRLRAICQKVAETPKGNRQTIAFQWAAQILRDDKFGPEAWDLVEEAMRKAGASDHDVKTALRERPGGGKVHA